MLESYQFDSAYFGDPKSDLKRRSGYSNYLEYVNTDWYERKFLKPFFEKYPLTKTNSVLELGAGIGMFGKYSKNPNWICLDVSSWCFENKVYDNFKKIDVLNALPQYSNNQFHFIVSYAFLDCLSDENLEKLKIQMDRVGIQQIHYTVKTPNTEYYNSMVKSKILEVQEID